MIFISHRLQEVFQIGDRVSVLKQGRHVATCRVRDATVDEILELIVMGGRAAAADSIPPGSALGVDPKRVNNRR